MERNLKMNLASALAQISMSVTRVCKEDYLYELVSIVETLDKGEDYVLFARGTGADGMDRFGDFEDIQEGISAAKQSLGVECVFVFRKEKGELFVEILNISLDKGQMYDLTNGFGCRRVNYAISE